MSRTLTWPPAEDAVVAILRKDAFANARLHYTSRIAFILLCTVIFAIGSAFVMVARPPIYKYLLLTDTGTVVRRVLTDKPNVDDKFIVDWAIDAITKLYTFDFVNFRSQLQESQKLLTEMGWNTFQSSMNESGNLNGIIQNMYVLTAVPTGPGKIVKAGIHPDLGRYAWRVEFPMLITYRSSMRGKDGRPLTARQDLQMSAIVIRQPEYLNKDGLGVRSIIAR